MNVLAAIVALAAAAFADAQEQKEPTLVEAKAAFAKSDRALNQAWSAAKSATTGSALTELTQSQRAWLEYRDSTAQRESEQAGEKNPRRSASYHSTAASLTDARAEWLRGRARDATADETLTGRWVDSYGGTMRLVQPIARGGQDGRLLFSIDVVRGPTYHTGGVAGVASWNERLGWWSDKGRDAGKPDESNLAFIQREGCLEVIGANTSHYHGARAYFDGLYCKAGTLDAKEQEEVAKEAESGEANPEEEG